MPGSGCAQQISATESQWGLSTEIAHRLDGKMDQFGVRTAVKQDSVDCAGVWFSRGWQQLSPCPDGVDSTHPIRGNNSIQ